MNQEKTARKSEGEQPGNEISDVTSGEVKSEGVEAKTSEEASLKTEVNIMLGRCYLMTRFAVHIGLNSPHIMVDNLKPELFYEKKDSHLKDI